MADTQVTWLGHAAFRIDSPEGKRIYVDPWLGNPKCPEGEHDPERIDVLVVTHGHGDHVGDTVDLMGRFSPELVTQVEVQSWLTRKGVEGLEIPGLNKGGTREIDGISFTMTDARHSSSSDDGDYLGESCGFVIGFENGTKIYIAGDTCVFGDMQLIARIYEPDVAILPIGDHFTMGPKEASVALELLAVDKCIPSHFGTFPLLRGTPEELQRLSPNVNVMAPEPGQTIEV
jgi:L-ascorbate metabolism protein UlaG (beta-lactamase superfamily)